MKVSSTILVIILAFLCMNITCSINTPPPPFDVNLNIPYYGQEYYNYCGPACVQMWARWDDNHTLTQNQIAQEVGISPNAGFANPYDLEGAVGVFTASMGYLERRPYYDAGSQGDLISSTIEGIKWSTPSIMPIDAGTHVILIKGYRWTEREDGGPLALRAYYHDPFDNMYDENVPISGLKISFDPAPIDYWVILGEMFYVYNGEFGHDLFVMQGGTYYGGPSYYNPKNLDIGIHIPGE